MSPPVRSPAIVEAHTTDGDIDLPTARVDGRAYRFHVQSGAAVLREGFPWFAYHASVSRLWAEKWRPSRAAGMYPFSDGAVADFDPTFAGLAAISGDHPAFLSRPDEYATPFLPAAQRLVGDAEKISSRRPAPRSLLSSTTNDHGLAALTCPAYAVNPIYDYSTCRVLDEGRGQLIQKRVRTTCQAQDLLSRSAPVIIAFPSHLGRSRVKLRSLLPQKESGSGRTI